MARMDASHPTICSGFPLSLVTYLTMDIFTDVEVSIQFSCSLVNVTCSTIFAQSTCPVLLLVTNALWYR